MLGTVDDFWGCVEQSFDFDSGGAPPPSVIRIYIGELAILFFHSFSDQELFEFASTIPESFSRHPPSSELPSLFLRADRR